MEQHKPRSIGEMITESRKELDSSNARAKNAPTIREEICRELIIDFVYSEGLPDERMTIVDTMKNMNCESIIRKRFS